MYRFNYLLFFNFLNLKNYFKTFYKVSLNLWKKIFSKYRNTINWNLPRNIANNTSYFKALVKNKNKKIKSEI